MTLVAAAVCPHPPILHPDVARGTSVAARAAARAAVGRLRSAGVNHVMVVGDAEGTGAGADPGGQVGGAAGSGVGPAVRAYDHSHLGSLAGFGVDVRIALAPDPSQTDPSQTAPSSTPLTMWPTAPRAMLPSAPLPLSLTIGAWLLHASGWAVPRHGLAVPATVSPEDAAELGAKLVVESAPGTRLGLLVMGDGSARRTLKAPGGLDERSGPFDATVADALTTGDADALAALDPDLARDLLVAGRASWQVLAGAWAAAGPPSAGWTSELLYDDAPYGVGYLVAVWELAADQDRAGRGDRAAPGEGVASGTRTAG